MVDWGTALATVAASGGIGAAIDFWIGKRGQRRVRDWLETWWLRFSYVRLENFGREEARTAITIMERVFDISLFSSRRLISLLSLQVVLCALLALRFWRWHFVVNHWPPELTNIFMNLPIVDINWVTLILSVVYLCVSTLIISFAVTLTMFATGLAATQLSDGPFRNIATLVVLIFGQILLFLDAAETDAAKVDALSSDDLYPFIMITSFAPLIWFLKIWYVTFILLNLTTTSIVEPFHIVNNALSGDHIHILTIVTSASFYAGVVANILRLSLIVIFVFSYVVAPFRYVIMTLWARIVESDTPVFTLSFSGTAAICNVVNELIKHL